jgi:hypothetical protein
MPPPMTDAEAASATFQKQVFPIFQMRCLLCHNAVKRRGGLDLLSVASLLRGGDSGPALTPGSLEKSLLWELIDNDKMPPSQIKLTPVEKEAIRRWILISAKDGRAGGVQAREP